MALSKKTKRWLSENCLNSFEGKTVLITGANSGIGFKIAETVVSLGARAILACRNSDRAEKAREDLLNEYPGASVQTMKLDISSFASIRQFADELRLEKVDVDVFVNNAGAFHHPSEKTEDGFDLVIGTNYIGVFYLTKLVMPYLSSLDHKVTYVNTISIIHRIGTVDFSDFWFSNGYDNFKVYARSKFCLARYSYRLAKDFENSNVNVLMNHPGISITPLGVNAFGRVVGLLSGVFRCIFNSPEKSSLSVALIMSEDFCPGSIIGPAKGPFGGWGYPEVNKVCEKVKVESDELVEFTDNLIKNCKN